MQALHAGWRLKRAIEELKGTIHYTNRSGVRATCPHCHVPAREFLALSRRYAEIQVQALEEEVRGFASGENSSEGWLKGLAADTRPRLQQLLDEARRCRKPWDLNRAVTRGISCARYAIPVE